MARFNPATYPPRYEMKVAGAGILQTAWTQNKQTEGWILSHCELNLSVMAERHQCSYQGLELD